MIMHASFQAYHTTVSHMKHVHVIVVVFKVLVSSKEGYSAPRKMRTASVDFCHRAGFQRGPMVKFSPFLDKQALYAMPALVDLT